jgi:hypothetical protein
MVESSRTLVLRTIAHMQHAHAQPGLEPKVAAVLAAEIRRLQATLDHLDGESVQLELMIDAAVAERARLRAKLAHAEGTLQRIMQVLGPDVPSNAECAGCASEIAAALDELHAYGIRYRPRTPDGEDPPDE